MKILWLSDYPTKPSGYGDITEPVCAGLTKSGHQVSILGRQTEGLSIPWYNGTLHPNSNADGLLTYIHQRQPDVLVTLTDIKFLAYLNHTALTKFLHITGIPWILYYSIDSDMGEKHLPPSWTRILKTVDLPIAMSRYGRDVAQANAIEMAYIPHGIDTKIFQPSADKEVAKQALGYKGKFVILSDARNQLRKMLPRTLEIFQRFAADKDDVILHLHCDSDDPAALCSEYCYNLRSDIAFLNLTKKVRLTKDMSDSIELPLAQLAQLYQAADVHLLTSLGEGVSLPTLQAAASGVVPLTPDYTANQELVQGHGEVIRIRHFLIDELGLRRGLIDIDDAVSKLETLYRDRELLACKAQIAREFALSYDWEHIVPQWEELLQHEIARKRTSPPPLSNISGHGEEDPSDLASGKPKAGELVIELLQDTQLEHALRIPVTLPPVKFKPRVSGCVYAASQCDVPAVLALHRIFPALQVWSTIQLDFASSASNGKSIQTKVVQANSDQYRSYLAVSTLALDMASFDPVLPIEAAKLGVPCIGLAQQREQTRLWPDLSLQKPDPMIAAELGRLMLTDQGVVADRCTHAHQQLARTPIPSNEM